MCTRTIIDANLLASIHKPEFDPLHEWIINGHGTIIYTEEKMSGYYDELKKVPNAYKQFVTWNRAGIAKRISASDLAAGRTQMPIKQEKMKSKDDLHVLELAAAGSVRLLCTDDQALQKDFKNREVLPGVKGQPARRIYPVDEPQKDQQDFLNKRKCRRK